MEEILVTRKIIKQMRLFYITRSYAPYDEGGGALMRKWTVDYLTALGWEVQVVRPEYDQQVFYREENVLNIPFKQRYRQKLLSLFERVGLYEDYLDPWVVSTLPYLLRVITKEDIVFCTSGGELGTIKLGALLKEKIGCKFVANFRDPLNYGYMQGLRRDKKPHVGRIRTQRKYLSQADLILTSSKRYCEILKIGFPEFENKLRNNYFGFGRLPNQKNIERKKTKQYTIAYTGNLSKTQKPEFIFDVVRNQDFENLKIVFIGKVAEHRFDLADIQCEVEFVETMPHDTFQKYMLENIDIGLVSLASDYYGACVPSKLYEYISLNLPILGFLPLGDAADIINQNCFGLATKWGDIEAARNALKKITQPAQLTKFAQNVSIHKEEWSMKHRVCELDGMLKSLNDGN